MNARKRSEDLESQIAKRKFYGRVFIDASLIFLFSAAVGIFITPVVTVPLITKGCYIAAAAVVSVELALFYIGFLCSTVASNPPTSLW